MGIPTLRTQRLVLRPFARDDAPALQELAGAREVAIGTLTVPHPYEDGVAEDWIGSLGQFWEHREALILAMATASEGLVGTIGLVAVDVLHGRGELGYWVGVPYWGQGYATEAGRAVLEYAFDDLSLNRVWAQHFTRNPASGRVLEKLAFRREGILRSHHRRFGEFEDAAVYGVLASEWSDARNAGDV
jgi:ribosomal-protein-alanine N-acetyltransferase